MFLHILDKAAVGIPAREIPRNIYIRFEVNFTLAAVFPNTILFIIISIEYILKML